jgi:hypothetical protein
MAQDGMARVEMGSFALADAACVDAVEHFDRLVREEAQNSRKKNLL